jgi:glycolate oxidase
MSVVQLWGQQQRPYVPPRPPGLDPAQKSRLVAELASIVGPANVLHEPSALIAYSYDATGERYWPDAVVIPERPEQVGAVLAVVARYGLPVIGRGAATNLSGGTIPLVGGVVVSMARLKHIRRIETDALRMVAEPGVVNAEAQAALARFGLFYPPDPASHRISTLGGNVSENSGGPHCVKYGVTTNHLVAVAGYLVDGTPVRLERRDLPGELDLVGLVCGSEGTLMLLTELDLAVRPLPEGTATLLVTYPDPESALRTVSRLIAEHVEPSCLELLDQASIRLVEAFVHAGYPTDAGAVLLIEVEGDEETRRQAEERIAELAQKDGALTLRAARNQEEADRLWLGRRSAYGALARHSKHVWVQDVTVPRPKLADMLAEVIRIGERHHVNIITVAHAGDGNLHPNISFNPADPEDVARMRAADREILEACVARNGSITGEHGIGIDKLENLALMYGPEELDMMLRMKRVFDPEGRLNPFKAVLTPSAVPPADGPRAPTWTPRNDREVAEAVREAIASGLRLQIMGAGRRVGRSAERQVLETGALVGIEELDVENLTAVVRAGTPMGALAQELAAQGLEWPVDALDPAETVGGVVAAALPPFRRQGTGPVRDNVLGVRIVSGEGRTLTFGRPTIKNVAGYDMTKLVVGSWGRLGVATALILKLRPLSPLAWRVRPGTLREQSSWAWTWLKRPDWPQVLLGTPDGLVTAWAGRVPDDAGDPFEDPREAWGQAMLGTPAARFGFRRPGPWEGPEPEAGPWLVWFGSGTVWGPERWVEQVAGASRPTMGFAPPDDPVVRRLSEAIRQQWDPHGIFGGDGAWNG